MPLGPGSVAALSPKMALERFHLSGYVRWGLSVKPSIQELAILVTARETNCPYVWNAHAQDARKAGVSDELISAIRDDQPLPEAPQDQEAVIKLVSEILTTHRVSEPTFAQVYEVFGLHNLVDLIALTGQYVTNGAFINAFELELPPGGSEPLLPSRN